jgi:hypothetical protein
MSDRVATGILLPESFLQSEFFLVLATFVAINTIAYVVLSVVKILPRVYVSDWFKGPNRRAESRSIYPDGPTGREPVASSDGPRSPQ